MVISSTAKNQDLLPRGKLKVKTKSDRRDPSIDLFGHAIWKRQGDGIVDGVASFSLRRSAIEIPGITFDKKKQNEPPRRPYRAPV